MSAMMVDICEIGERSSVTCSLGGDIAGMSLEIERNLGEQPVALIIRDHDLKARDLVSISTEQITHKMVSRACKGRRLTPNVKSKIRNALNSATDKTYSLEELFTY